MKFTDVSEVLAASILKALMLETARLHGATTQGTALLILAAVRS
jgi:hypothetical protein